jgi:hypothetical protein
MLNYLVKIKDKLTLYIEDYIEQKYLWKTYGKNNKKASSKKSS